MVFVLVFIHISLLSIFFSQMRIELTSFSEKPITQLFPYNNSMLVIAGSKSFNFDKETKDIKINSLNGISSISPSPSIFIKQLKGGIIGIACSSIALILINDKGEEIAKYNSDHFDETTQCSLVQLSCDRFLLSYLLKSVYAIDFIQYYPLRKTMNKESRSFSFLASAEKPMISCESFILKQIIFCVYLNRQVELYYFSYDYTILKQMVLEEKYKCPIKLVKINETYLGVFILNRSFIQGNIYTYNEIKKAIEEEKKTKSLLSCFYEYEAFDVQVIQTLEESMLPLNIAFVIISCTKTLCILNKFNFNFEELIDVVRIPLNEGNKVVEVSLGLFNEYDFSIITREDNANYLMQYNVNMCLNTSIVYLSTNESLMLIEMNRHSSHADTIEIMILSTTFKLLNYMFLDSDPEKLEKNRKYPLNKLIIQPMGGVYLMKYQLFYNLINVSSKCQIKLNVCFKGCKTCSVYGTEVDMKCIDCADGYFSSRENPHQCYEKKTEICEEKTPYWMEKEKKCVSSCELYNLYTDIEEHICSNNCNKGKRLNKISNECLLIDNFNEKMNKYIREINTYVVDLYNNFPFQQTDNYIFNIYNTSTLPDDYLVEPVSLDSFNITYLSTVYLNNCEELLKIKYGYDLDTPLLIAKFDYKTNSQITKNVNYSVYSIDGTPLNLSLCEDSDIRIVTPIFDFSNKNICLARKLSNKAINVFHSEDPFFTDICNTYSTEQNTDIPLSMRIKEYYLNYEQLCNPGCESLYLDYNNMFVVCSCSKNIQHSYLSNYTSLINRSNTFLIHSNLEIFRCYHLVFDANNLVLNFGHFIVFCLVIVQLINTLYFVLNGMISIENALYMQIKNKNWNSINYTQDNSQDKAMVKKRNLIFNQSSYEESLDNSARRKGSLIQANNDIRNIFLINNNSPQKLNAKQQKKKHKQKEMPVYQNNNLLIISNDNQKKTKISGPKVMKTFKENNSIIYHDNSKDIYNWQKPRTMSNLISNNNNNNFSNSRKQNIQLIRLDKLNQIYLLSELYELPNNTLLATNIGFKFYFCSYIHYLQPIIRAFFFKNLFKIRTIKISLFIFFLILTLTCNALFFSEKYLIKSYLTKGKINIFFNLPIVLYSFCIGLLMRICINSFSKSLSVMYILKSKQKMYSFEQKRKLIIMMKTRMIIYYILQWIIYPFCWYYVSVFCAVYPNIQLTWAICVLVSFIIEQLFSLLLCGFIGLLSVISTRYNLKWMRHVIQIASMMS